MKMKDIKTLITSGTILIAVALYMIFGEAPPEKVDETTSQTEQTSSTGQQSEQTSDQQVEDETAQKAGQLVKTLQYVITPEMAQQATGKQLIDVEFLNANDGDTMNVEIDGEKQRVRLLMIDTPEMNYNKGEPMPYAEQAKEFTTQILENASTVQVLFDVGPETDNYDRLLTYLFVDGVSIHELLLREGLAAVRYVNKPNNTLEQELRDIQAEAEAKKINIWSKANYLQKDGFHPEVFNN